MDEAYQVFRNSCIKHKENETVGKGTKYAAKKLLNGAKGTVLNLIKTLFSIGKESAAPKKSGKKKKTGKLIPVLNKSRVRRVHKTKGRGHAGAGRKVNPKKH